MKSKKVSIFIFLMITLAIYECHPIPVTQTQQSKVPRKVGFDPNPGWANNGGNASGAIGNGLVEKERKNVNENIHDGNT